METFKTPIELATYFKTQELGAVAEFTGLLKTKNTKAKHRFAAVGVIVSITGTAGHRIVTFIGCDDNATAKETTRTYNRSHRTSDDHLLSKKRQLLIPGSTTYVEGRKTTIRRQLKRWGLDERFELNADGNGWMLTIKP